jgi:hypothetical protein
MTLSNFHPEITPDPERFSWIQSGYLVSGTLQEYADCWERRQYDGDLDVGLSEELIRWTGAGTPVLVPLTIERTGIDENDYIKYRFTVPIAHQEEGTTAYVSVDGRA